MVWPFSKNRESRQGKPELPILTLCLDQDEVCVVHSGDVPIEKVPVIELCGTGQVLRFVDGTGGTHAYDLSSVYEEGMRFVHLSVRVGPTFAVQPDALLTTDGNDPKQAFEGPDGKGIRLQPFYLPQCCSDPEALVGRGLFYRGLHYSGMVTQSNVSLLCICDHCAKSFRVQSFHAGFSNLTYLYCSKGPHTLVASNDLADAPPVLGEADAEAVSRFENNLPPCEECGGEFRYMNPFRCPHCLEPYIDFHSHPEERASEYYGNYLYGRKLQRWAPET